MRSIKSFREYINQYVALKNSVGIEMKSGICTLLQFERMANEMKELPGISKNLMNAWCNKRPDESSSNRYSRVVHLRQFAQYLTSIGIPCYIPELPKFSSSFTPYIFSKKQIDIFFTACDQFKPFQTNYNASYFIMPTLFKVLYATGLRLGEALSLKNKDVDLDNKYVRIRESKNGYERIVPISKTLADICRTYREQRKWFVTRPIMSELFFIKKDQSRCTNAAAYGFFRQILWQINIAHGGRGAGPRVHDLRHTFACHALKKMTDSGLDYYYSLPILSNYLGHRSLAATNKYVRLTAELYPDILKTMDKTSVHLFPVIKLK